MSARVCIDIRITQTAARHTGTGVYAYQLVRALQSMKLDFDLWYLVLANYALPQLDLPSDRLIRVWRPPKPERWHALYDIWRLSETLSARRCDLVHCLVPAMIRPVNDMKVVVTLHDLIPLLFPADYRTGFDGRWLYRLKLERARQSHHLIADSNATKQDLIQHARIPPAKTSVVYLAPDPQFRPASRAAVDRLRDRLNLPVRYVLYLGGYSARKNVQGLLHAFHRTRDNHPNLKLVLAGSVPEHDHRLLSDLARGLRINNDVIWLGRVDRAELPALYTGAALFVYPSIYEGFGLPVLEAMACGSPVITSNVSSLPEVAGNAAMLVNPLDDIALGMAMTRALQDLSKRAAMIECGYARAADFSWSQCAFETASIYRRTLLL